MKGFLSTLRTTCGGFQKGSLVSFLVGGDRRQSKALFHSSLPSCIPGMGQEVGMLCIYGGVGAQ